MSSNVLNPRKPLLWLLGAAVAAAFFASGALVARATIDDDGDGSPDAAKLVVPGIGMDGSSAEPAITRAGYGPGDVATNQSAPGSRGAADMSYPGCRGPLPAGVLTASGIDWSKASFTPSLPSSGFSGLSLSLSAQGVCDKNGVATAGPLVLDTSWTHDATGLEAYVSQRASSEQVASVIRQDSATFWANGYVFNLGVNAYHILPAADGGVVPPGRGSTSSGAGVDSDLPATDPARPAIAPAPDADPRAAGVLRELISQLAPSLNQQCFWTAGPGDWSSLTSAGVGDPRPAIPSGYTLTEMNSIAFNPPEAGCDTSLKPVEGFNFNANWQKGGSGDDFAYIGISVYGSGETSRGDFPGQIGEYGANWSNGQFQFGVYAKSNDPIGIETVRAIAKALDPSFNEACFIKDRKLSASELPSLGFSEAKAPSGYSLVQAELHATEIEAGCEKPAGFETSYNLNWAFEKGADAINASANRYGAQPGGNGSGYETPNHLSWTDAKGTNFNVNAFSKGVSPTVSKDDLIAVARSMDPTFDISKLQDGPEGKPLPADERSARP